MMLLFVYTMYTEEDSSQLARVVSAPNYAAATAGGKPSVIDLSYKTVRSPVISTQVLLHAKIKLVHM